MPISKTDYKRWIPLGLFILGLSAAVILSFKNDYWSISSADYESLRCYFLHVRRTYLDMVTTELQAEGKYKAFSWFFDHNSAYYLYLSYLTVLFQLESSQAFLLTQIAAIFFLMGVFPTLIYKITNRISFAFASLVLFFFMPNIAPASMFQINDSYWAYYLVIAIGMPVLYILMSNKWSPIMWYYSGLLALTNSVCHLARSNAGIFLWMTLLVVIVYKHIPMIKTAFKSKAWKLLGVVCGICLIAYSPKIFTTAVPNLYLQASGQDVSERLDTMGPWHSLYIGLGWTENPDGLYYEDTCGYEHHPDTLIDAYLPQTVEYIEAVKGSYFETLAGHPFFYLRSYLLKVAVSLVMCMRVMFLFGIPFYLIPSAIGAVAVGGLLCCAYLGSMWYMIRYCLKNQGKQILKKLDIVLVLGVICLANGLLPAIIAMPTYVYLAGAVGAYDLFVMLSFTVVLAHYLTLKKESKLAIAQS